jgi:hypothetical protein
VAVVDADIFESWRGLDKAEPWRLGWHGSDDYEGAERGICSQPSVDLWHFPLHCGPSFGGLVEDIERVARAAGSFGTTFYYPLPERIGTPQRVQAALPVFGNLVWAYTDGPFDGNL